MTKIKICGLTRISDIDYANMLKLDYIGFVFAPKSKRYISYDRAEKLRRKLDKRIVPIGVFVNEEIENIEYLITQNIIDIVQLHGNEDNEYIKKLSVRINCPVIQAFCIENKFDIENAEKSAADYILLDSGGGTGKSFDHTLLNNIKRDFFLAGGLDSKNVGELIKKYNPYAVDASSSLETNGLKDREKMTAFVNAVRY